MSLTVEEFRRIANSAQPHVVALCTAIGLDPERDLETCKIFMRAVIDEAVMAVLRQGRL